MVWLETKAEKALRHCRDVLQVLPDVNNNMASNEGAQKCAQGKLLPVGPGDPSPISFDAQRCPLWAPRRSLIDHCPDSSGTGR